MVVGCRVNVGLLAGSVSVGIEVVVVGYRVNVGLLFSWECKCSIEVVVVGYRVNVGLLAGSVSVRY